MEKFRYQNLFIFSSLQFIGNIEEYFVHHTEKLVVHIVMPRTKTKYNIVRLYKRGRKIKERKLWTTENIFLYYSIWYLQHLYLLFTYFSRKEEVYVMSYNPITYFGISMQKLFRKVRPVFFIGDYCPAKTVTITMFEGIKKYYHDHVDYACYLSDTINIIMNGKIINANNRKTVMWGVKPQRLKRTASDKIFTLLFVGLVKDSQGLEYFFTFLRDNKEYFINILGVGDEKLYAKYQKLIKEYKIEKQIYYPNKFFSDSEVTEIANHCHAGLALYDTGKNNMTYYTEPGKVKYYAELGLPVIMSNTSAIIPYIKQFHAGEIVTRNEESIKEALKKIKSNYDLYQNGLKEFNTYFYYETYYKDRFIFLEN